MKNILSFWQKKKTKWHWPFQQEKFRLIKICKMSNIQMRRPKTIIKNNNEINSIGAIIIWIFHDYWTMNMIVIHIINLSKEYLSLVIRSFPWIHNNYYLVWSMNLIPVAFLDAKIWDSCFFANDFINYRNYWHYYFVQITSCEQNG